LSNALVTEKSPTTTQNMEYISINFTDEEQPTAFTDEEQPTAPYFTNSEDSCKILVACLMLRLQTIQTSWQLPILILNLENNPPFKQFCKILQLISFTY